MTKCPDCQSDLGSSLHNTVHEVWAVRIADMEEYEHQRKIRENAMEVEVVYQGITYRGTVYPVEEREA